MGQGKTNLNVGSTHAQCVYRSLDARLGTRSIDDDICTESKAALFDEVFSVLLCADSLALEAGIRGILEREVEALIVDVHGNNLLCAVRLRDCAAK